MALTPNGGQTLRSHFRLTVHPTAQPPLPSPYDYSDDAIAFDPVTGVHSGGVVFVKYSTGNSAQTLRKPLIVAEGFDPSSVLTFILNNSINNFYWDTYNLILDDGNRFWNTLISEYDIVFLDYNNGVDDIFRNARLLEQVIEWANAQKVNVPDAQPNVVLGVSMGGLVSRVALRRMEVEGKSHDTRLYISLDSPHKGANIPPAYQALAWHVNGYLSFVDPSLSKLLYAPSVKQMLKYYPDPANSTFISTHHNTFMTQYDALGFPTTTRNVAIANGSNSGTSLFNPYSVLIDAKHRVGKYTFTVKGYSMPNELNKLVYEASVVWKISGSFWRWFFGASTIGVEMKEYYSSASQMPYDGAPGGYYPLSMFGGLPAGFDDYLNFSNFTFIPVASALAVSSNNPFEVLANQNLIGAGRTSFDTYYAQVSNQSHTQFTPQNARFILNELAGTNLCIPISGVSISGPDIVCSIPVAFTLNNLPTGCSVSWSRSSNLAYVSGQGTATYRVKAASPTTSGSGWVRATVSGPCGDVVLPQHDLWIGAPSSLTRINGFPNNGMLFGSSSYYNFSVSPPNIPGVTQYDWIVFGGTILSGQGTNSILVLTGRGSDESPLFFDVNVRAGNPCGFSSWFWRTGYVVGGVGPIRQGQSLTVSPNPASGNFTVSEVEPANNNMSWILCLMNQQGAVMVNVTTTLPKTINVQGLQPGVYLLHARQGDYVEQLRVVVE